LKEFVSTIREQFRPRFRPLSGHSADPAYFNCNVGASLAIGHWVLGRLRMPPVEPPRLTYGVSGNVRTRMA
jgi:hypothetical protein